MKKFILLLLACVLIKNIHAQEGKPVTFNIGSERKNDSVFLTIDAKPASGFLLFHINPSGPEDAFISQVKFDSSAGKFVSPDLKISEPAGVVSVNDSAAGIVYKGFQQETKFYIPLNISKDDSAVVKGTFAWLGKLGDEFPSGEENFTVKISAVADAGKGTDPASSNGETSLWVIFLSGLAAGFGALFSPCIYAMLPVTVSFFLKRSKSRKESIRNALMYSLSIIGVFTLLGFLITLIFGPGALNALSSSAGFNIIVFLMFMLFGISFLGAFEISLPSSWATKMDAKASLSSFSGIFFMAMTLVIVSFSCTVPFIGGLTALIASGGKAAPLVGFFAFSLALALPFALFALFPGMLNKLARSGGWLNTIKVIFGFLEIALAFKFLSSADLAYHWRLLDREIYLSIWIVVFGLMGLYLLGKLKLKHDDDLPKNDYGLPHLSVTRLFFAIAVLSFVVYMIPGLWGAPLNGISAWLPEMKTQDFNLNKAKEASVNTASVSSNANAITPKKYTDILESEIPGVTTFFDYEEGLAAAKQMNKKVMIDFTGHACANCRKMEREVLSNDEVVKKLQNDFVVISLYVDDKFELPESEWKKSADGTDLKQMGEQNLDFEIRLTNNNSQPQYVFVDSDGKIIENAGGYNPDVERFLKILDKAAGE